jgi:hypothetical protein
MIPRTMLRLIPKTVRNDFGFLLKYSILSVNMMARLIKHDPALAVPFSCQKIVSS